MNTMALGRNKLEKARKPPKSLVSPISSTVAREKNLTEGEPEGKGNHEKGIILWRMMPYSRSLHQEGWSSP